VRSASGVARLTLCSCPIAKFACTWELGLERTSQS